MDNQLNDLLEYTDLISDWTLGSPDNNKYINIRPNMVRELSEFLIRGGEDADYLGPLESKSIENIKNVYRGFLVSYFNSHTFSDALLEASRNLTFVSTDRQEHNIADNEINGNIPSDRFVKFDDLSKIDLDGEVTEPVDVFAEYRENSLDGGFTKDTTVKEVITQDNNKEVDELKAKIAELEEELENTRTSMGTEIKDLKSQHQVQLESLNNIITANNTILEEYKANDKTEELTEKLTLSETKISDLKLEISSIETKLQNKDNELYLKSQELEELRESSSSTRDVETNLKMDLSRLNVELSNKEIIIQDLEKRLNGYKVDNDEISQSAVERLYKAINNMDMNNFLVIKDTLLDTIEVLWKDNKRAELCIFVNRFLDLFISNSQGA